MVRPVGFEPTSSSLREKDNSHYTTNAKLVGPEDGFEPSRISYLLTTTGGISPSASPEDSGMVPNRGFEPRQLPYERSLPATGRSANMAGDRRIKLLTAGFGDRPNRRSPPVEQPSGIKPESDSFVD